MKIIGIALLAAALLAATFILTTKPPPPPERPRIVYEHVCKRLNEPVVLPDGLVVFPAEVGTTALNGKLLVFSYMNRTGPDNGRMYKFESEAAARSTLDKLDSSSGGVCWPKSSLILSGLGGPKR